MFEIAMNDSFYAPYIKMGASHIGKTKTSVRYIIIHHEPIYNLDDVMAYIGKWRKYENGISDNDLLSLFHGMSGDQLKDIRKAMTL